MSAVNISKERFVEVFHQTGESEKSVGLWLEKNGFLTYRNFQKNLQNGRMNKLVLEKVAEHLECKPEYFEEV